MIDYFASFANTNNVVFPDTLAVNASGPSATDGTEFVKLMIDDIWGFNSALMDYASLTPDAVTEAPGTSQRIEAIQKGFAVGPGMGVIYWKDGDPAANGDRVLLLNGQTVLIANYPELVAATYVGDGNNATATAFYKTSDTPGTVRDTAGPYFVLPETRGYALRGLDTAASVDPDGASRDMGSIQLDSFQGWQAGMDESDDAVAGPFYGTASSDDLRHDVVAQVNQVGTRWDISFQGDADMIKAQNDGTNGDPRTATETRMVNVATRWAITY